MYDDSLLKFFPENYSHSKEENNEKIKSKRLKVTAARYQADGNINTIEGAIESIREIIDVVFDKKINLSQKFSTIDGELPAITYNIIKRSYSKKTPKGPMLVNNYKEEDKEGELTGDSFNIYVSFYDCHVEFEFYAATVTEMNEIKHTFENCIEIHKGILKRAGLSNIYYMDEYNGKSSSQFEAKPSCTLLYYFEIQKINSQRVSSIKTVSTEVEIKIKESNPEINDILEEIALNNNFN